MSLPGNSSIPAVDPRKEQDLRAAGAAVIDCLRRGLKPRDIMTREAFLNAIRIVMALGGSTNAVLHLLAIAHEAEVDLTIDDFNPIAETTPTLADLKPAGRYVMKDLDQVGGVSMVMRMLLDAGLLHGDCITVSGRTIAENLADVEVHLDGQDVVYPVDKPLKESGGILVIKGNLAPEGAVLKSSGVTVRSHRGPARVFDAEEGALQAILKGQVNKGDVLVIRYEGPRGGPGMREMLALTSAIAGAGLIADVAADHRRPLLRRQPRHRGGPHRPRGAGPRPDRGGSGGRHYHPRPGAQVDRGRAVGRRDRAASRGAAGAAHSLHSRRPGQVRAPGLVRQPRRHNPLTRGRAAGWR